MNRPAVEPDHLLHVGPLLAAEHMDVAVIEELELLGDVEADPRRKRGGGVVPDEGAPGPRRRRRGAAASAPAARDVDDAEGAARGEAVLADEGPRVVGVGGLGGLRQRARPELGLRRVVRRDDELVVAGLGVGRQAGGVGAVPAGDLGAGGGVAVFGFVVRWMVPGVVVVQLGAGAGGTWGLLTLWWR